MRINYNSKALDCIRGLFVLSNLLIMLAFIKIKYYSVSVNIQKGKKNMKLKKISSEELPHIDKINERFGSTINETYECLCGKGVVEYEEDRIPGLRGKNITCNCSECSDLFTFGRGTAELK